MPTVQRIENAFTSGGGECAAWMYMPDGDDGDLSCIVMANGFSLTRHDGMPIFADAFADAGYAVLAFDYRHLGDSASATPGRIRLSEQLADWKAAVAVARAHPRVDPGKVVPWSFSLGGGQVVKLAAKDDSFPALLLVCPFLDGFARVLATEPRLVAWILPRAMAELAGAKNIRIKATDQPGRHGAMTLPGEADGFARSTSPHWRNEVGPALFATIALSRPVTLAAKLRMPVFVAMGGRDVSVSNKAVARLADEAPRGELHTYAEADHFDVLMGDTAARIASDQLTFLQNAGV